jgi:rhamnogalacturonyl hydrolase YesR
VLELKLDDNLKDWQKILFWQRYSANVNLFWQRNSANVNLFWQRNSANVNLFSLN